MRLLVAIALCTAAMAQQALAQEFFLFNEKDRPFLQYYFIWNQFDSSVVMYEFGEAAIVSGSGQQRVLLADKIRRGQKIQGTEQQGVSTDLEALARTEDFIIPTGGSLQYYGQLQAFRTPCDRTNGAPGGGRPNHPTAEWGIMDRTEFVLQLVRSSDDAVVATVDSSGVRPTETAGADTRYGGDQSSVKHSFRIPDNLQGTKAYLRISPRRYGPTPLGLTLNKESHWVNLTALYDSSGREMLPTDRHVAMRQRCFEQMVEYCDSMKHATGHLPNISGIGFSAAQKEIFHSRFYEDALDSVSGVRYIRERRTSSRSVPKTPSPEGRVASTVQGRILEISPNPVGSGKAAVRIHGLAEFPGRLRLMSASGSEIGVVWTGAIAEGTNSYALALPALANGTYLLVLEKASGEVLSTTTLVVAR